MEDKGYCPNCNRGRAKGEWQETELKNSYVDVIHTTKGHRKLLRGTCSDCEKKVTKFISNKPMEEK